MIDKQRRAAMNSLERRRTLRFQNFSESVADARDLLARGYLQLGKWNLSQTLGHLSDWLRFPVEGYPSAPFPLNFVLWGMKITIGPGMRRKIIRNQEFSSGKPTMPSTVKAADQQTDAQAMAEFERVVAQFESHSGSWHASPLFGNMTRNEHRELQLLHVAHHLSFLIPKREPS